MQVKLRSKFPENRNDRNKNNGNSSEVKMIFVTHKSRILFTASRFSDSGDGYRREAVLRRR